MNFTQECALEVPRCHGLLTFDFRHLEKRTLFISAQVLGTQDFMVKNLLASHNFS